MKLFLIISSIISIAFNSHGCLNGDSKELSDGTVLYMDREGYVPQGHDFFESDFKELEFQFDSLYNATNNLDYLSDKGLILILSKEYKKAIQIYKKIESIEPNRYSTASNIGTAYELIGENEKALKWITKSVKLDSSSHYFSEWIHINILEAKLDTVNLCNSDFLLGTNFGNDPAPKSELSKDELDQLFAALYFQLNERLSFIKSNDNIVAQLLFDLGNITFLKGKYKETKQIYDKAKSYGYKNKIIDERLNQLKTVNTKTHKVIANVKKIQNVNPSNLINEIMIGLAVSIIIILIYLKRKKRS